MIVVSRRALLEGAAALLVGLQAPAALAFTKSLELDLDNAAAAHPNPGGPTIHRLNRAEYSNAIRDLLAIDVDPVTLLPADDSSNGFDNIADVLGMSPALMERYVSAAAKISRLAVGDPEISPLATTYTVKGDLTQTVPSVHVGPSGATMSPTSRITPGRRSRLRIHAPSQCS